MFRTTLFAISLVSLSAQANAQSATYQSAPSVAAPQVMVPGYYQGYYGRSSTLQEGIQHGYADVLRAEGEQAYNVARAADQLESAREKWMSNRQQAVQQYFALREMNQSIRKTQTAKSTTKTSSYTKVSHSTAAASPAQVLSSGKIVWPVALQGSAVAVSRKQLDRLFSLRASGHEVRTGSKEYRQAVDAISRMDADLKASIDTLSATDYLSAKKMLQSLKHELTQPTQQELLTQNSN